MMYSYKHVALAMGTKLAPALTIIYIGDLEEHSCKTERRNPVFGYAIKMTYS